MLRRPTLPDIIKTVLTEAYSMLHSDVSTESSLNLRESSLQSGQVNH